MKKYPIHTILFAIFPVLFLYSINIAETSITETIRPSLILFIITGILFLVLSLLIRNIIKTGLIVSIFFILTFLFGPIRDIITPLRWPHPQQYLFVFEVLLFVLMTIFILRIKRNQENLNFSFNIISIILIATSLISGIVTYLTGQQVNHFENTDSISSIELNISNKSPDIYYIITDGYTRSDVFQKMYGCDNSNFIEDLKNRGFFVANKSLSNYSQTSTSLPSSLNMTYLDKMTEQIGESSANLIPMVHMIKNNLVSKLLKNAGYTTVAFSTGYWDTEIKESDLFLSSDRTTLTDFESLILDKTPVSRILSKIYSYHYDSRRETVSYTLDNLGRLPKTEKPKFVFAHIPAPHEPYVFDEYGNEIEPSVPVLIPGKTDFISFKEKNQKYCGYTQWLNRQLISALERILEDSTRQSIMIIQGDHGSNSYLMQGDSSNVGLIEKMAILNAYYFYDRDYKNLYDTVSPVNSFRIIFNQYFGTDLDVLEDKNYFSRFDTPYNLIDVTSDVTKPLPDIVPWPAVHNLVQ